MLPIALNLDVITVGLAGRGKGVLKRLQKLDAAGATELTVFCDEPTDAIAKAAGDRLMTMLPTERAITELEILMVVDMPEDISTQLASIARRVGTLVNVEDVKELCDFYFMSEIRRGDLQLAIGTNGASPGLAVSLRQYLEARMGDEWAGYTEELKQLRATWQQEGKSMGEILSLTKTHIEREGWLPPVKEHTL